MPGFILLTRNTALSFAAPQFTAELEPKTPNGSGASSTWSAKAAGTAGADRRMLVALSTYATADLTALTVAGVAATKLVQATVTNLRTSVWLASVPSGATVDVIASYPSGSHTEISGALYNMFLEQASPYHTNAVTGLLADSTAALQIPANGGAVFAGGSDGDATGTPLTVVADDYSPAVNRAISAGHATISMPRVTLTGLVQDGSIIASDPAVRKVGSTYYMAFTDLDPDNSFMTILCGATSSDGITWTPVTSAINPTGVTGTLLKGRADPAYDNQLETPTLLNTSGSNWLMYYEGHDSGSAFPASISVASSSNNIQTWTRINSGDPIISPTPNGYDNDGCISPTVMFEGANVVMFYTGHSYSGPHVGVHIMRAVSTDGINFTKDSVPIFGPGQMSATWLSQGIAEVDVVDIGSGRLLMLMTGLHQDGNSRSIGFGVSDAGTDGPWNFCPEPLIIPISPEDKVLAPTFVVNGANLEMWYLSFDADAGVPYVIKRAVGTLADFTSWNPSAASSGWTAAPKRTSNSGSYRTAIASASFGPGFLPASASFATTEPTDSVSMPGTTSSDLFYQKAGPMLTWSAENAMGGNFPTWQSRMIANRRNNGLYDDGNASYDYGGALLQARYRGYTDTDYDTDAANYISDYMTRVGAFSAPEHRKQSWSMYFSYILGKPNAATVLSWFTNLQSHVAAYQDGGYASNIANDSYTLRSHARYFDAALAMRALGLSGQNWTTRTQSFRDAFINNQNSDGGYPAYDTVHQPGRQAKFFQDALICRSAIFYYDNFEQNASVLAAIRRCAEHAWKHIIQINGTFNGVICVSNTLPYMERYTLNDFWQDGNASTALGTPDLNAQWLDVFGWLAFKDGDTTWITRGDALMARHNTDAWLGLTNWVQHKNWEEAFGTWSWRYSYWKANASMTTLKPRIVSNPTITGTKSPGSTVTFNSGTWTGGGSSVFNLYKVKFSTSNLSTEGYASVTKTTATTKLLTSGESGSYIFVEEVRTNGSGAGVPALSPWYLVS